MLHDLYRKTSTNFDRNYINEVVTFAHRRTGESFLWEVEQKSHEKFCPIKISL